MRRIDIDEHSGFCPGVIRVVNKAQEYLREHDHLYSLGAVVHNEEELTRLQSLGLVSIDWDRFVSVSDALGEHLLVRAHGEPPVFYQKAAEMNYQVIDCTCPVVLKLQKDIREAFLKVDPCGGCVVIFGKVGHAEVLGLVGQTDSKAIVVEDLNILGDYLAQGRITAPVELFSQTTMDPAGFRAVCERLGKEFGSGELNVHNTICHQVSSRQEKLREFASSHDVVVFVSGKSSSNGKVLYDLCRSVNPETYQVSSPQEIDPSWFAPDKTVGVCGATSTPRWLLEKSAQMIENLQ